MCYSRSLNNKVNHLHEKTLRTVYQDLESGFSALLVKDNSITFHQRNLQIFSHRFFKVKTNVFPEIMNEIFDFSRNSAYDFRCVIPSLDQTSILNILKLSPLQVLPQKCGIKYITKSKKQTPLQLFLKK